MSAHIIGMGREGEYRCLIKSLYAQFFHQMMADLDAVCLRVLADQGYSNNTFNRQLFDAFIQGKQAKPAIPFQDFKKTIFTMKHAVFGIFSNTTQ